ncbi:MAG: hypothetical protein AAFP97_10095 [Pseudomonadota bacterium]
MIDWFKSFFGKLSHASHILSQEEKLRFLTSEIQTLVDAKFEEIEGEIPTDSPLSQVNLLTGDQVVYGYLADGEFNLAFHHLKYMVDETGIIVPHRLQSNMQEIATSIGGSVSNSPRNQTKVIFERQSICAGDDVHAPNLREFYLDKPPLLSEALNLESVTKYLPSVSQSKTCWLVICNGEKVARIQHFYRNERPTIIKLLVADTTINTANFFFQYEGQEKLLN